MCLFYGHACAAWMYIAIAAMAYINFAIHTNCVFVCTAAHLNKLMSSVRKLEYFLTKERMKHAHRMSERAGKKESQATKTRRKKATILYVIIYSISPLFVRRKLHLVRVHCISCHNKFIFSDVFEFFPCAGRIYTCEWWFHFILAASFSHFSFAEWVDGAFDIPLIPFFLSHASVKSSDCISKIFSCWSRLIVGWWLFLFIMATHPLTLHIRPIPIRELKCFYIGYVH